MVPNDSPCSSGEKKKPGTLVATATPTRVSIKEANDHLQLLHKRVMELETIISHQASSQKEKEEIHKTQFRELKSAKESQIEELTKTIVRLEDRVKDLESEIKQKNSKLEESQRRLSLLDVFILDSVPTLNNLLYGLKELSVESPSPVKDQIQPNGRASSGIGIMSESNGSASDSTSSAPEISTPTGTSATSACDDSGFFLVSDIKSGPVEKNSSSSSKEGSTTVEVERDLSEKKQVVNCDTSREQANSQTGASRHSQRTRQARPGRKVMLVHNASSSMHYDDSYDILAENGYFPGTRVHSKVGRSFSIISNFSEDEETPIPASTKLSSGIVDL